MPYFGLSFVLLYIDVVARPAIDKLFKEKTVVME